MRHFNRIGVLAHVLAQLRDTGINIEEMQNQIFDYGETASCTITLNKSPSTQVLERIRKGSSIIEVTI